MDFLNWVLGLAAVFIVSQYLLGPTMVYFSQKLPDKYRFKLIDPSSFLSERGDIFNKLHEQILANEFRYVGSSELQMSNSSIYFSIYYSEERTLTCTLMTAHAAHHNAMTQIEFTQLYTDGSALNVNNNAIFSAYPDWDTKECYRFPDINDFNSLLGAMDKIIKALKSDSAPLEIRQGKEFEVIESHLNYELERLIDIGWVSPVTVNGEHRFTVLGALLMTWKMCWPIRVLINKVDVNRSREVLESA